jgi:hypothetical protein
MSNVTAEQVTAGIRMAAAVGEAIRDLGSVPSGHLYARLMGHMSPETYNKVISLLVKVGAVKEENHLLTWVGK